MVHLCCLNALLVLKLFWQSGHAMTMSTCVSQCLRMSFFAGMVFPHVEQLQLPDPKFWLIIESNMRLSSKHKQNHFFWRLAMESWRLNKHALQAEAKFRYFEIYWMLIGHIPRGTNFTLVIKGIVVGQAASWLETLVLANATGVQEIQMGFNMPS